MKICLVHNEYGKPSGEEMIVEGIQLLLEKYGHEVILFIRSSAEIKTMPLGSFRAFFSGIYSHAARRHMRNLLALYQPDLVHIHNLFPLISPSILRECRLAGIPVLMTVHNYRLTCPDGLHISHGRVCEECLGGREYWCVFKNCEGNLFKSLGYSLRSFIARRLRLYLDNVTLYATLTNFQRQRLIAAGFPSARIYVIPNMVDTNEERDTSVLGQYIGYVGRISEEKGIWSFLAAAVRCGNIPFKLAGEYSRMPQVVKRAPDNVEFVGFLDKESLYDFYSCCRIVVLPSICFEGFSMAVIEAMLQAKPIVCSHIGGMSEIVEEKKTGLFFEPGNSKDLTEKLLYLWDRPELCRQMGKAGREKVFTEYSREIYYERLMGFYREAISLKKDYLAEKGNL